MSPKTLRNWRVEGKGPVGTRRGREVVFGLEAVVHFEAQQEEKAEAEQEAKLLSDSYKITVRQHPKYPERLQADLLLPSPYKRARLAVPNGMVSEKDIDAWARREGKRIMQLQKLEIERGKEEAPKNKANTKSDGSMTLADLWGKYRDEYLVDKAPGTRADVETSWRLHIGPELGDHRLEEIDIPRVRNFRQSLVTKLKKASTRNKVVTHLTGALRYAATSRLIRLDDVPSIKDEKEDMVEKPIFNRDEIEHLNHAASAMDIEHEAFLLLLTHGCLRIGELHALHWTDIDLERNKTMRIQRTEWRNQIQDAPKGHVGVVPLTRALHDALHRWKASCGSRGPLVLPGLKEDGQWGPRRGPSLLGAILHRARMRVEGPHMIRHSVLTHLAEDGASPYALQALARHAHMSTTMKYYIHLEQAKMAGQAVALLDRPTHPSDPVTPVASPVTRATKLRIVKA